MRFIYKDKSKHTSIFCGSVWWKRCGPIVSVLCSDMLRLKKTPDLFTGIKSLWFARIVAGANIYIYTVQSMQKYVICSLHSHTLQSVKKVLETSQRLITSLPGVSGVPLHTHQVCCTRTQQILANTCLKHDNWCTWELKGKQCNITAEVSNKETNQCHEFKFLLRGACPEIRRNRK